MCAPLYCNANYKKYTHGWIEKWTAKRLKANGAQDEDGINPVLGSLDKVIIDAIRILPLQVMSSLWGEVWFLFLNLINWVVLVFLVIWLLNFLFELQTIATCLLFNGFL